MLAEQHIRVLSKVHPDKKSSHSRCQNAEQQIVQRIGDIVGTSDGLNIKVGSLLNYYFYNEGGPVKSLVRASAKPAPADKLQHVNFGEPRSRKPVINLPQVWHLSCRLTPRFRWISTIVSNTFGS